MNATASSKPPAPLATSVTSPSQQTRGKVVTRSVMHLDQIPGAMDRMGWTVAARLMRHWFSIKPAWVMPRHVREGGNAQQPFDPMTLTASQYDDRIVTMKWLRTFPRVGSAIQDLVENWASKAGKDALVDKLTRGGWRPSQKASFALGSGVFNARELEGICQVNFRTVGSKLDPLDDLYGAIGIATLKIAVVGRSVWSLSAEKNFFHPEKLGIYLKDLYEFSENGFESAVPLGIWSPDRCLSKAEMIGYLGASMEVVSEAYGDFVPVYNRDFRRWQKVNDSGGDFVVFSDVMWIPANVGPFPLPDFIEGKRLA